jgi:hypothetical protein
VRLLDADVVVVRKKGESDDAVLHPSLERPKIINSTFFELDCQTDFSFSVSPLHHIRIAIIVEDYNEPTDRRNSSNDNYPFSDPLQIIGRNQFGSIDNQLTLGQRCDSV